MNRKKHILIADDEQNLLHTMEFILEAANYKVSLAKNGKEALDRVLMAGINETPIDLLITDIKMPGINGLELVKKLKRLHINIPILVITEYGSRKILIDLMRLGCNDYLEKPIDDQELLQHVAKLV